MTGKQEDCDTGGASTMNLNLVLVLVFAFVPIDVLFASLFVQTKLKDTYAQNYDQWTGRLHKQYPPMLMYFYMCWCEQGDYRSSCSYTLLGSSSRRIWTTQDKHTNTITKTKVQMKLVLSQLREKGGGKNTAERQCEQQTINTQNKYIKCLIFCWKEAHRARSAPFS